MTYSPRPRRKPRFIAYPSPMETERERASVKAFEAHVDAYPSLAYGDPAEAMVALVQIGRRLRRLLKAVRAEMGGAS